MKETEKFLDSYAIIEILKNNPNYASIAEATPVSTRVHLIEVAYHLLSQLPKEGAATIINSLNIKTVEIQENQVLKIAAFRKEHAKKKFSYIDCIGYVLAKENSLPFVTGDKQFEGM
ncbi:MAG: PIN domain-containing protein, partial [Candidatus Diapherotrites archaeon]|nr:PIN domain-containing protein [Candidatus Diapherotrites archaeon]